MSVASILSGTPAVLNPDLGGSGGPLLTGVATIPSGQSEITVPVAGLTTDAIIMASFAGGGVDTTLYTFVVNPVTDEFDIIGNENATQEVNIMWYVVKK